MAHTVRILEITNCGECPHLDNRWQDPPWYCQEAMLDIFKKHMRRCHEDCPLDTREQYVSMNRKLCLKTVKLRTP